MGWGFRIFLGMKYLLLFFILLNTGASGQNPGPRLVAMGSGGTALQGIWSLQQNPAGAAGLKKPAFAIAYERQLQIPDLSTQMALFIIPYRRNVLGFSFERYGITEYREQTAGLSYARNFGQAFRLAMAIKYFQLSIFQYGSANAFSIETGFQINITENFIIGSHIANPNRSTYREFSGSNLPVKISLGASVRFSDKVLMIADLRKSLNHPLDVMTGVEYNVMKWFSLRGGASVNPFKQYMGFELASNKLKFDFAVASHASLGYSPQIALSYEF